MSSPEIEKLESKYYYLKNSNRDKKVLKKLLEVALKEKSLLEAKRDLAIQNNDEAAKLKYQIKIKDAKEKIKAIGKYMSLIKKLNNSEDKISVREPKKTKRVFTKEERNVYSLITLNTLHELYNSIIELNLNAKTNIAKISTNELLELRLFLDNEIILYNEYLKIAKILEENDEITKINLSIGETSEKLKKVNEIISALKKYKALSKKEIKLAPEKIKVDTSVFENNGYKELSQLKLVTLYKNICNSDLVNNERYLLLIINEIITRYKQDEDESSLYAINFIRTINKNYGNKIDGQFYLNINRFLKQYKSKDNEVKEEINPMVLIILELMKSDQNYEVIRNIIIKNDYSFDVYNIRGTDDKHFIFDLLELLFASIDTEIRNQTSVFIRKEFYAKVIKIFVNGKMKLDDEEYIELQNKLQDYVSSLLKRKPHEADKYYKLLESLLVKEQVVKEEVDDLEKFFYPHHTLKTKYTESPVYSFKGDKFYNNKVYSLVTTEEGDLKLTIFVSDATCHIDQMSKVYDEMKKNPAECSYLDNDEYKRSVNLNQFDYKPTIFFEFIISQDKNIIGYKVGKTLVQVDDIIDNDSAFKSFNKLFQNDLSAEENILTMASDYIEKKLSEKEIPLIYRVQDSRDVNNKYNLITLINHILIKLEKVDAKKVVQAIVEDDNYAYFSMQKKQHFSLDSYKVDIFKPVNNYYRLLLQEIIIAAYTNRFDVNDILGDEIVRVIDLLNHELNESRVRKTIKL